MSEPVDPKTENKALLKSLLTRFRPGMENEGVAEEIATLMGQLPDELVIEAEQELIQEGALSPEELTQLCDLHSRTLKGVLAERSVRKLNPHHPLVPFLLENKALKKAIERLKTAIEQDKNLKTVQYPRQSPSVPSELEGLLGVSSRFPFGESSSISSTSPCALKPKSTWASSRPPRI